ncbi:uncharacterized protein [Spinacia oleracea]|uniref:Uncharacterized protein n=1 Tax=Spinacia oleracea TaxID=3562 RepID=A0ABM3QXC6_SPIOL|nr:uncharacterized protein LOC130463027 [Spinacia oleracea]
MAGETKRDDNKVGNISELLISRDKLRELALLMHLQEAQRIQNVEFRSVYHRIHYLRDSRNTYESAIGILDSVDQIDMRKPAHLQQDDDKKYKDDAPRIEIVQRINSARKTKAGGEEENPDNNGNQERGRGRT